MAKRKTKDADLKKGAIENDKPQQPTQESMAGQLPHRTEDSRIKGKDTDFPEPGNSPEHSGEALKAEKPTNPEYVPDNDEPGFSQKMNQNKSKDDPLAA